MHWQMFVALCFASFNSQELPEQAAQAPSFFVLDLGVAGKLPIPAPLIHDLEFLTDTAQIIRIRGYNKNRDAFFQFVFSPKQTTAAVFAQELKLLELDKERFEVIAQAGVSSSSDYEIYQIGEQPPYSDQLLAKGSRGNALLFFIGSQESFYHFTPLFTSIVEGYSANPMTSDNTKTQLTVPSVVTAILMLVTNIFFIWLGFREIARYSEKEE